MPGRKILEFKNVNIHVPVNTVLSVNLELVKNVSTYELPVMEDEVV